MGTLSILQAMCVTRSKFSCLGRLASVGRKQDQFSPGLTKDPSPLIAAKPEEKLDEGDVGVSIGNEYRENENIMHQIGRTEDRVTISGHKNRAWLSVFSGQLVTAEYRN